MKKCIALLLPSWRWSPLAPFLPALLVNLPALNRCRRFAFGLTAAGLTTIEPLASLSTDLPFTGRRRCWRLTNPGLPPLFSASTGRRRRPATLSSESFVATLVRNVGGTTR